jgi:hypothetical protein
MLDTLRIPLWRMATRVLLTSTAVAASSASCVIVPPGDLPVGSQRPVILHGEELPSADQPLTMWPGSNGLFSVAVATFDPNPVLVWSVFVDYNDGHFDQYNAGGPLAAPVPLSAIKGGVYMLPVPVDPTQPPDPATLPIDLTRCHTIQVLVGHGFAPKGAGAFDYHAFDPVGGDTIAWQYQPNGPSGCLAFPVDAGPAADEAGGSFPIVPPSDAGP